MMRRIVTPYQAGAGDGKPVGERQLWEPDAAFFGSILPVTEELAEEKEQETWLTFL